MTYEVRRNVGMPARKSHKYPFSSMAPGDSFQFPTEDISRIRSASSSYGKRHGMEFSVRRINGINSGCWRQK